MEEQVIQPSDLGLSSLFYSPHTPALILHVYFSLGLYTNVNVTHL